MMKKNLSDKQISNIIVCLLYVSSENTALGLVSSVVELARSDKWWNIIKNETNNETEYILKDSKVINSCVMEASRLNSNIFGINRKAEGIKTIRGYNIEDVDEIAICVTDKFFNPDRLIENKEQMDAKSVMKWGVSTPLYPGNFALYEIKIGLALIVKHFNRFKIDEEEYRNVNYFSLSAYAVRIINVTLNPITEFDIN